MDAQKRSQFRGGDQRLLAEGLDDGFRHLVSNLWRVGHNGKPVKVKG
jgi:hypothetical protein